MTATGRRRRRIPSPTSEPNLRALRRDPDVADYVGRALVDGSPLGITIFDTLLGIGLARWTDAGRTGRDSPRHRSDVGRDQLADARVGHHQACGHVERQLPEPLTTPAQLQRWLASVTTLLREGLFRRPDAD